MNLSQTDLNILRLDSEVELITDRLHEYFPDYQVSKDDTITIERMIVALGFKDVLDAMALTSKISGSPYRAMSRFRQLCMVFIMRDSGI